MEQQIQIYHLTPFSRSTRVIWLLEELGPKIKEQFVIKSYDIKKPQEFKNSEEFKKITPLRRFPTLVDGTFVLTEGIAINNYILRTKAPDSTLLPKDQKDLATYESVNAFLVGHIDELIAKGLNERFLTPKDKRTRKQPLRFYLYLGSGNKPFYSWLVEHLKREFCSRRGALLS